MAVILFKDSGYKICDENSFTHELENGWFLTKKEALEATKTKAKTEIKTDDKFTKKLEELKAKKAEEAKAKVIEGLKAEKLKLTKEIEENKE